MSETDQIDMHETIELLGITQPTFYRWLREGRIHGSKVGRRWRFARVDIERLARGESAAASAPNGTGQALSELQAQLKNVSGHSGTRSDDPIDDLVHTTIELAVALDASDVHLEPQRDHGRMRFRIDGVLQEIITMPNDVLDACLQNWKGRASCNVTIKDLPQDGRLIAQLDNDLKAVIRITVAPTALGESICIRFLVEEKVSVELERLEFPPQQRERVDTALQAPHGLVIVSGPTGSGKTTTLYALLNELVNSEDKIMSVEDPVEFIIPGVNQLPVKDDGMTFSHAMRACLRSDPDVLMVGELRDKDMVTMIHQAALSGILVLTAMHAKDAITVIQRLRDIGIDKHLIVDAMQLIICQQLVRRLCPDCAKKIELDSETQQHIFSQAKRGGINPQSLNTNWHEAVGCKSCNGLGYKGRAAIYETVEMSPEIRQAIIDEVSLEELDAVIRDAGFSNLTADAIQRAANGQTSIQELRRVCAM